jgi:hypothetical protein
MVVSASPAARAVRTACFAEQMEQKKQLLITSSQKSYHPAFHSLNALAGSAHRPGEKGEKNIQKTSAPFFRRKKCFSEKVLCF